MLHWRQVHSVFLRLKNVPNDCQFEVEPDVIVERVYVRLTANGATFETSFSGGATEVDVQEWAQKLVDAAQDVQR